MANLLEKHEYVGRRGLATLQCYYALVDIHCTPALSLARAAFKIQAGTSYQTVWLFRYVEFYRNTRQSGLVEANLPVAHMTIFPVRPRWVSDTADVPIHVSTV